MGITRRNLPDWAGSLLLVAIGGFGGSTARYAIDLVLSTSFPWGTLAVNVAGSFALGVLLTRDGVASELDSRTKLLVGTGFVSSFTTYSTFALETAGLTPTLAALNILANYGLGMGAVVLASLLVRREAT